MAAFVKVATTGELAPGQAKRIEAGGRRIALFNRDGAYYAIEDTCPHRGGPLSEGQRRGGAAGEIRARQNIPYMKDGCSGASVSWSRNCKLIYPCILK